MKTFLRLVCFIATILLLSSCNPALLEPVFFSKEKTADIYANSYEVVTSAPSDIYWQAAKGGKYEAAGTIPAKTKLRVLGALPVTPEQIAQGTSPDTGVYLYYIVELPNGSRVLAKVPEAVMGLKTRLKKTGEEVKIHKVVEGKSYVEFYAEGHDEFYKLSELKALPHGRTFYNPARIPERIAAEKLEKRFVGKSLQQVEQEYMLADRITVNKGAKTAYFLGIMAERDSTALWPLTLTVVNDTVRMIDWSNGYRAMNRMWPWTPIQVLITKKGLTEGEYKPDSRFKGVLLDTNIGTMCQAARWSQTTWVGNIFVFGPTARLVISIIIGMIMVMVFYGIILRRIAKLVYYIKPLSNSAVEVLALVVYLPLVALTLFFGNMGNLGGIFIMLVLVFLIFGGFQTSVEYSRCPHCHAVNKIRYVGKRDEKTSRSQGTETDREFVVDKVITTTRDGRKISERKEGHHEEVTTDVVTVVNAYTEILHCDACDREITYRRSDVHEKRLGSRRRKL